MPRGSTADPAVNALIAFGCAAMGGATLMWPQKVLLLMKIAFYYMMSNR